MFPFTPFCLGGRTYIHSLARISTAAHQADMKVEGYKGVFLFSPLIYRYSPKPFVVTYHAMEQLLPPSLMNVRFWKLRKSCAANVHD